MKNILAAFALLLTLASPAVADTLTTRLGLLLISTGSANWGVKLNNSDFSVIDSSVAGQYVTNTFTSSNTFLAAILSNSSITASGFFGNGAALTGIPSTGSIVGVYLPLAGGTMTGALNLSNVALNLTGPSGNIAGASSITASGFFGGMFTASSGYLSSGGNTRGANATDLQTTRTNAYEVASGQNSTIGGGGSNNTSGVFSTVSGGSSNTITSSGDYSTIGGGRQNSVGSADSTIGGGKSNIIGSNTTSAFIGGGLSNTLDDVSDPTVPSAIAGGRSNSATNASFVGGGRLNSATNSGSVLGGLSNSASNQFGAVGGGQSNTCSGSNCVIGGGSGNTASGQYSVVPGGLSNQANGVYSFAAGRRSISNPDGSMTLSDSTDADFVNSSSNSFRARFSGGYDLTGGSTTVTALSISGNLSAQNLSAVYNISAATANIGGTGSQQLNVRGNSLDSIGFGSASANFGRLTYTTAKARLFAESGNALTFGAGGTFDQVTLDTAGSVGIGTATPSSPLTVNQGAADTNIFELQSTDVDHPITGVANAQTYGAFVKRSGTGGGLAIEGINDSASTIPLIFRGLFGTDPTDTIPAVVIRGGKTNGGTGTTTLAAAETLLQVQNNDGTVYQTVLGNGNVGISTITPGAKLHAQDLTADVPVLMVRGLTANNNNSASGGMIDSGSNLAQGINRGGSIAFTGYRDDNSTSRRTWAAIVGAKEDATNDSQVGYLAFRTLNATTLTDEKMRITSGGNVGIGLTAPRVALDVKGELYQSSGTAGAGILQHTWSNSEQAIVIGSTSSFHNVNLRSAGVTRLSLGTSGGITATSSVTFNAPIRVSTGTSSAQTTTAAIFANNQSVTGNATRIIIGGGTSGPELAQNGTAVLKVTRNAAGGGDFEIQTPAGGDTNASRSFFIGSDKAVTITTMTATYSGGSAHVCVTDAGVIFASEAACP